MVINDNTLLPIYAYYTNGVLNLKDASGNSVNNNAIPYADLTVTSNVNTAVAGAYHVTYTYTLADGKTISITTKVKVSAKDNANNTSGTPAKKTTATKKGHLFPKTSDSTSAVSLIVLCASLTALGIVVYKRKRF